MQRPLGIPWCLEDILVNVYNSAQEFGLCRGPRLSWISCKGSASWPVTHEGGGGNATSLDLHPSVGVFVS